MTEGTVHRITVLERQKEGQNDERDREIVRETERQSNREEVRDRESEKALQGAPKETEGGEQSVQIQTGSELLS